MAEEIDGIVVKISGDASDLESVINSVTAELENLEKVQSEAASATEKSTDAEKDNADAVEEAETAVKKETSAVSANTTAVSQGSTKVKSYGEQWEKTGKKISEVGTGLDKATKPLQNLSLLLAAGGVASAKFAIDFEDNFANVKKTVDGTDEQLATIKQDIIDMTTVGINGHSAIPKTTEELTELAAAGGQLGIQTENISGFTETMAMVETATNLAGEEGAATLAKFANVTKMSQSDFDRLGSSIVALGNNFATTEADIAAMAMRLGGAGTQIGLNQADILGIATALSSVGIEAEAGGSAFSKAMIAMQSACSTGYTQINSVISKTGMSLRDLQLLSSNSSKDFKALADDLGYTSDELNSMIKSGVQLENFAKITGRTSEEFKNLFESSPSEAIDAFIKGLQNADSTGESAIEMLQDMGFTEVRLRDSLLRLANSEAGVTDAVTMSNEAWQENTALQNEFEAKAETTASKLAVTKNNFIEAARGIGETMLPTIKDMSSGLAAFAQKLSSMSDSTKKSIVNTGLVIVGLGAGAKTAAGSIKTVGDVIEGVGKIKNSKVFQSIASGLSSIPLPAAAAVAGIALLGVTAKAAYDGWYDSQYRWTKGLSEGNEKIKESLDKYKDLSSIQREIKSLKLVIENPESSQEQVNTAKSRLEEIKELLSKEYNLVIKSDNSNLEDTVEKIEKDTKNNLQRSINEQTEKLRNKAAKESSYENDLKTVQDNYDKALTDQTKYSDAKDSVAELFQSYKDGVITFEQLEEKSKSLRKELGVSSTLSSKDATEYDKLVDGINNAYDKATGLLTTYSDQEKSLISSHEEYIAICTELSNWETELIEIAAKNGDDVGVKKALEDMKEFIADGSLDLNGYAQAAAKAWSGVDNLSDAWEKAANGDGADLDNYIQRYVWSMQEFGATAHDTATGAALLQNGFTTLSDAIEHNSIDAVVTDYIKRAGDMGEASEDIVKQAAALSLGFSSFSDAVNAGQLDAVTEKVNDLGEKMDMIPEGKHLAVTADGNISVLEDVQAAIDTINQQGDTIQLQVSANGDVSVLSTADQKLQDLIENNKVTITFNTQTNGFDIGDLQTGKKIGTVTADGKINWMVGETPKEVPNAKGTADFELGTSPTEVPDASGKANFTLGDYPKTIPGLTFTLTAQQEATGTQNFSGGLAMVNDQTGVSDNRELIVDHGRAFIPEGRNVILPLSKGAKVYTAAQTKAIMSGMGIPRYADGKDNSDAFTSAKDNWSHYTKTHAVTTTQELQKWVEFSEQFRDNEKDIADIEEQIFSLRQKIVSEMNEQSKAYVEERAALNDWEEYGDSALDAFKRIKERNLDEVRAMRMTWDDFSDTMSDIGSSMYSDRISQSQNWLDHEEKYNALAADEYIVGLERMAAYTQEYFDAGLISYREYAEGLAEINDSIYDKRAEANDAEYAAWQKDADAWEKLRSTYDDWDKYGDSEEEFLKRKIQRVQEFYAAGKISFEDYIDDMNEYSMNLYTAQSGYIDDMLQKQSDYISDLRQQFSDEEQALRDSWDVEDRTTDMADVQEQLDLYSGAVTDAGQKKYKELQEQMQQLQRDEELYQLQVKNNATIESLEAEYSQLEDNKKTILENMRSADIDISGYVNGISESLSNTGSDIVSLLGQILNAFGSVRVDAPSYSDNRVITITGSEVDDYLDILKRRNGL